jgi:hypothetical protein
MASNYWNAAIGELAFGQLLASCNHQLSIPARGLQSHHSPSRGIRPERFVVKHRKTAFRPRTVSDGFDGRFNNPFCCQRGLLAKSKRLMNLYHYPGLFKIDKNGFDEAVVFHC